MAETELERAEKRYAQARARLQALKNREAAKERKLDTRRKVILGGALIDLAGRDSNASAMLERLVRNLPREQDRSTFADWDVKTAAVAPAGDPVGTENVAHADATTAHAAAPRGTFGNAGLSEDDREVRARLAALAAQVNAGRRSGDPA